MRTLEYPDAVKLLAEAGFPATIIHPCDMVGSLFRTRWVNEQFGPWLLAEMKRRNLIMRREIFDCEDTAMHARDKVVEAHQKDPMNNPTEDPAGLYATGIWFGFAFVPGHSFNVGISSDEPDKAEVKYWDFTTGQTEPVAIALERINACRALFI